MDLEWAINELKTLSFSSRLIKGIHRILLQGVRGEKNSPDSSERAKTG